MLQRCRASTAALGDLPIERLWTDPDFVGDKLPFASVRKTAAVPRDPCVQPVGNGLQRENFRAQSRALQFPREIARPNAAELRALREQLLEACLGIRPGLGRSGRDGVAMVALGVQGRFGQNRSRARSLEDQDGSVALVPNQMDRACQHEMHFLYGIAAMEQGLATADVPLPDAQALQESFDGIRHDNYHVVEVI